MFLEPRIELIILRAVLANTAEENNKGGGVATIQEPSWAIMCSILKEQSSKR